MAGDVKVAGLTIEEVRAAIRNRGRRMPPRPRGAHYPKGLRQAALRGEVGIPGRFELRGRITTLEAFAIAGGFKAASAKHSQVGLLRRIDAERAETTILNMKRIIRAPKLEDDIVLRPGDMLLVPQNRISKIERIVRWSNVVSTGTP